MTAQIEALQAELAKKDVTIGELRATIDGLNANIATLNEASVSQQTTITTQHNDMNRVWYVVANAKELKDRQIVTSNGLFRSKSVLNKKFDDAAFTQVDLNQFTILHTNSKRPRILSSHPEDSYVTNVGGDKLVTIEIKDPVKFWSISKYLVVQTER